MLADPRLSLMRKGYDSVKWRDTLRDIAGAVALGSANLNTKAGVESILFHQKNHDARAVKSASPTWSRTKAQGKKKHFPKRPLLRI